MSHSPFYRTPRSVSKFVALLLLIPLAMPGRSLAQETTPARSIPAGLPLPQASPDAVTRPVNRPVNQAVTAQPGYVLGAGDHIVINVFGYEEYTGDRTILPDGTIAIPLIGSIQAAGQTTDQFAQALTARLQPFLVDP
jgi:protein involved in polysaccharide export with SLBB domain